MLSTTDAIPSPLPGSSRNKKIRPGRTQYRLTALPKRNLAVADKSPPSPVPCGYEVTGLTLIPAPGLLLGCCRHSRPKPLFLSGTCLHPQEGKHIQPGKLLLERFGVFFIFSLQTQVPISHPFPQLSFVGNRNRWAFPEKSPHAFPTSLLLPLPLGNAAPWLPWQPGRADLLLPVGQRHRARAVGLPLAPVLWISMGCSRHMLHRPRDAHVVLRKASQGIHILLHTPPTGVLLLVGLQNPVSQQLPCLLYLSPRSLWNMPYEKPTPFPLNPPPTALIPRWTMDDKCVPGVSEWA